ncbi:MAG: tetratricopeptide repeat protein, partial [Candidatus Omnitrophica bacterium]|nr:tetratricopeptide repeat protein [Candidatus Omnitrophota bacterium]
MSNKVNLAILVLVLVIGNMITPFYAFSLEETEEKFYIAVKAFSDGFYDASLSLFNKFIESFPDNYLYYDANLYIAKCYYEKKDYPQALETLTRVDWKRGNYQKLDEVYYWMSLVYLKGKNFKESYSYAQKIIDDYPQSQFKWKAYYLIANNHLETGKENEAKEILVRIIKQSREKEVIQNSYSRLLSFYFEKKLFSEIVNLGKNYLADSPQGELKTKVYFYLAESYYTQGRWSEAILNYQKVLESKQNAEFADSTYQGLGFAYLEQKQNQEAKANIDKIRDKQLRLFSQGIYYSRTKDFIQALEIFDNLINNYPDSLNIFEVYLQKADLLYEIGRLNDAIYAYQYIINNSNKTKPSDIINKAYYGLAWCYLKNGNFKKAIEEFKNTLEYTSNPVVKVSSQIQIADAYQEAGQYQKALDIYNNILQEYPDTIYLDYIQFQIGMSLLKNKDLEKSFLALKNLKNNFPSSRLIPQAQYYLAVGYFSQEDYSEAKILLENFIAKFPKDNLISKVYYLYGKCFFNENKYEETLNIFKKILKDYKDIEIEELVCIDIGNVYLNLSQFDKAKSIWHDFLNKYPNS